MLAGMDQSAHHRPAQGHAGLRLGRRSIAGHVYLVTFVTRDRRPLFSDPVIAHDMARAITDKRLWYRSRLLAWVLMPDHWHGLIELGAMETLPVCVQRLKANTSRSFRVGRQHDGVWAPGFHDRAMRSSDDLRAAARYVIANPLRAGLVDEIGKYPYWDAVWLGNGCLADRPER